MLDSSLVEDKSLCPVRGLKVYLEKTKFMRKGKALLFVSLREGYSKDITRITISQWIKHTIQACYQSSDMADQQVTQVRAHDVRAMAASLAFKGGISLEQVLSSCYWKSHNTFTNFYLKDICWENDDIFKVRSHCVCTAYSKQLRLNNIISIYVFRMYGMGLECTRTLIFGIRIWIRIHVMAAWLEGQLHSDCCSSIQLGTADL